MNFSDTKTAQELPTRNECQRGGARFAGGLDVAPAPYKIPVAFAPISAVEIEIRRKVKDSGGWQFGAGLGAWFGQKPQTIGMI
jgi:hypothetical protein